MASQLIAAGIGVRSMRPVFNAQQTAKPSEDSIILRTALPPGFLPFDGYKSIEAILSGVGAENSLANTSVYLVKQIMPRGVHNIERGDSRVQYACLLAATIQWTLGTLAGTSGRVVDDTQVFADTAVVTEKPYGAYLAAAFGKSIAASSPGSNGMAVVGLADAGNHIGIWLPTGPATPASPSIGVTSANLLAGLGT